MHIGVIVPTFEERFDLAQDSTIEADRAGLDGVFVYDHLWPMSQPGSPAIAAFPALGALTALSSRLIFGTLVARVGVVAPSVLERELMSCSVVAGGRFIAAIGTGDKKSAPEMLGYGLEFRGADERRSEIQSVATGLISSGVDLWVGGGAPETNALARSLGATLNLWGATPERVAHEAIAGPVSWAGKLPTDEAAAANLIAELDHAGATWAIFAWPGGIDPIARVMEQVDPAR